MMKECESVRAFITCRFYIDENVKMLAVLTNDISDQKYFIHLIRTSLTKSGKKFEPIRNIQYFSNKWTLGYI